MKTIAKLRLDLGQFAQLPAPRLPFLAVITAQRKSAKGGGGLSAGG